MMVLPLLTIVTLCSRYTEILEAACEAIQQRRSDEANELTDILSDASMASILTDYAAWLVTAQVDYKAWTTANEAFQRRYCANHGGRNAQQHHKFIATMYADFFEALIEALPAERQLAMSANVRAVGVLAILDSGAGHLYADGAGQILRPCSPLTAQQAGGTSMHTDREWDFELFVKDHKDQVYKRTGRPAQDGLAQVGCSGRLSGALLRGSGTHPSHLRGQPRGLV